MLAYEYFLLVYTCSSQCLNVCYHIGGTLKGALRVCTVFMLCGDVLSNAQMWVQYPRNADLKEWFRMLKLLVDASEGKQTGMVRLKKPDPVWWASGVFHWSFAEVRSSLLLFYSHGSEHLPSFVWV